MGMLTTYAIMRANAAKKQAAEKKVEPAKAEPVREVKEAPKAEPGKEQKDVKPDTSKKNPKMRDAE